MSLTPAHLDTILWQAANPGDDPAMRDAAYQRALDNIDQAIVPPLPTDEEGYRRLTSGRNALASLYCYAFNRKHPAFNRVSELENKFAALQARYNRRFLVTDPDATLIARAHLWAYSFISVDSRAVWVLARDRGVLAAKRHVDTGLLVPRIIGLQRAVGDNTFTTDSRGRDRRRYLRTIGRQAFLSERSLPGTEEQQQAFLASVPLLDDLWRDTEVADRKYGATGSRIGPGDRLRLHQTLNSVPEDALEAAFPTRRSIRITHHAA